MKIDKKTLVYLADLAKLKLKNEEIDKFSHQLSDIVLFVEKLKEIKPKLNEKQKYLSLNETSRDDEVSPWPEAEKSLALKGKDKKTALVKAPKIR